MLLAAFRVSRALLVAGLLVACSDSDPGESWVPLEDDQLAGVNFGLVWGVGDDVWTSVEPPDNPLINTVMHFDGDRWEYVAEGQGLGEHIVALWASSPDDLWVAARSQSGEFSLWHGDGSSWSQVAAAFTGLSAVVVRVTGIWGTATDDVWVTVELEDGDDVALRYDGETWQVMFQMALLLERDNESRLLGGCSYDRDDVVLRAGTPETSSKEYMLRWDGAAWNEVSFGDVAPDGYVSLLCQGGGAWGITGARIYSPNDLIRSDGQGGWETLMLFDPPSRIADVWIGDNGDGWILGVEIPDDPDESGTMEIWRLSDGVATPTLADDQVFLAGTLTRVWQTVSGRVFAFGDEDLVLEYVGPE